MAGFLPGYYCLLKITNNTLTITARRKRRELRRILPLERNRNMRRGAVRSAMKIIFLTDIFRCECELAIL